MDLRNLSWLLVGHLLVLKCTKWFHLQYRLYRSLSDSIASPVTRYRSASPHRAPCERDVFDVSSRLSSEDLLLTPLLCAYANTGFYSSIPHCDIHTYRLSCFREIYCMYTNTHKHISNTHLLDDMMTCSLNKYMIINKSINIQCIAIIFKICWQYDIHTTYTYYMYYYRYYYYLRWSTDPTVYPAVCKMKESLLIAHKHKRTRNECGITVELPYCQRHY